MKQDLMHEVNNFIGLKHVVVAGDGDNVGEIIDMKGFESLTYLITTGLAVTGVFTPKIEKSSSPTFAQDVVEVTAKELLGTIADATLTGAGDSEKTSKIGVVNTGVSNFAGLNESNNGYRYFRLTMVGTGTAAAASLTSTALLGHPNDDQAVITQKPMN